MPSILRIKFNSHFLKLRDFIFHERGKDIGILFVQTTFPLLTEILCELVQGILEQCELLLNALIRAGNLT